MEKEIQRPVCRSNAPCYITHNPDSQHFQCPVCGNYEWNVEDYVNPLNKNQYPLIWIIMRLYPQIVCFSIIQLYLRAMGLGKPVIQLCKRGTELHFDIAQKNTIMWASEDDIPEQLQNRIIATIE